VAWRVYGAAVTGTSHVEVGLPCQDAWSHRVVSDTLVAVVCDGAGSAAFGQDGAQWLAQEVTRALAERLAQGLALAGLPAQAFRQAVAQAVGDAREALAHHAAAASRAFAEHAATLVGVVADARQGCFFHIGDGVGAARLASGEPPPVSLPENGEYANETYFVTGTDWQAHLRFTPIAGPAACVALMSDGAAPFVMSRGLAGFCAPFLDPVERYLLGVSTDEGSRGLEATLSDARTHAITPDDKTLVLALWAE
jgi:hypothetical protein